MQAALHTRRRQCRALPADCSAALGAPAACLLRGAGGCSHQQRAHEQALCAAQEKLPFLSSTSAGEDAEAKRRRSAQLPCAALSELQAPLDHRSIHVERVLLGRWGLMALVQGCQHLLALELGEGSAVP